jgi:hypothetical protein
MGVTQKQLEKWAKTRQMGRARYVWRYGVLGWGLATGVLWSICRGFLRGGDQLPVLLVLALIIFPIGGYFFGQWTWKKGEENFQQGSK